MHPIHLIYSNLQPPDIETIDGVCCITGKHGPCIPRKDLLGKSFTNSDLLKCPESEFVGIDVYTVMKHRPTRSSWFCDEKEFIPLTRLTVREMVFQKEMPPIWAAYATTSFKKHGALKTKINTGKIRIWLFEERLVDCTDIKKVRAWFGIMDQALRAGISRPVIESLECAPFVIEKIGLKNWLDFERWARPKYQSALYSFMAYLLPSQQELKDEINQQAT